MDKQVRKTQRLVPDYKRIYRDILEKKFPEKIEDCQSLLEKKQLNTLDIQKLNQKVFGISDKELMKENRKYCSYSKADILRMLDYQKKNKLNNRELAQHFKLSRNSVSKWRKLFI